jgi:hypothetical protein
MFCRQVADPFCGARGTTHTSKDHLPAPLCGMRTALPCGFAPSCVAMRSPAVDRGDWI